MINNIINEDDYIRECKEAITQLLRRNNLWNDDLDMEQNLRELTIKGWELLKMEDDRWLDSASCCQKLFVNFQLIKPCGYPPEIVMDKDNMPLYPRKVIDSIKWRITGKF